MDKKDTIKSSLDGDAPIDLEVLKLEVEKNGPLRCFRPHWPVEVIVNVKQCDCGETECDNIVIAVDRVSGLSKISWLLEPEDLDEFESLTAFSDWAMQYGFENSRGERLIMEKLIERSSGHTYHHVDKPFCACSACAEHVGPEAMWKATLLSNLAINLIQRNQWRELIAEQFSDEKDEDTVELFDAMYELGYHTARMFGEYQLKDDLEGPALLGLKAKQDQEKRAEAAGKVSQEKRHARIDSLLSEMETIVGRNPDFKRLGSKSLADLALADVKEANPDLWSQGMGRRDEYLDEMKSDVRYRQRYKALFAPKTA